MKVSKVLYKSNKNSNKALAMCDIVISECLRLEDVCLYKNEKSGYFLVFPSRQDIYKEIEQLNQGVKLVFPPISNACSSREKKYEEFFYPMSNVFYRELLAIVVDGYEIMRDSGKNSYIPE